MFDGHAADASSVILLERVQDLMRSSVPTRKRGHATRQIERESLHLAALRGFLDVFPPKRRPQRVKLRGFIE